MKIAKKVNDSNERSKKKNNSEDKECVYLLKSQFVCKLTNLSSVIFLWHI